MPNPNYVIVKLDDPVGPDDAQNLAQHIVQSIEFADVASAQPARSAGLGRYVLYGEEVSVP
jgi:hypothetical protein